MKPRPSSGGPSPDRHRLQKELRDKKLIEEKDEQSNYSSEYIDLQFLKRKDKVFAESEEASVAIQRAKAELVLARDEVNQQIANSEETLNKYRSQITDHNNKITEKVNSKLEEAAFTKVIEKHEESGKKRERFVEKIEKKVLYKCAFGQKIAADLEWIVGKKKIEKKDEILFNEKPKINKPKEWEIIYDMNGRPRR